jgi:hypothetical protein
MEPAIIGAFIPIIFFLVSGLIWVSAIYLRSRERQMLIEKGLSPDQIQEYFERKKVFDDKKKDSYILLQIGIIFVFFGLGLGFGMMLQDMTDKEYWTALFIFTGTGLGFIIANLTSKRLSKKEDK